MFRLILYCLLFCLAGNTLVSAQVYHYLPISYSDPEINPSVVLSDRYYNRYAVQHANSFSGANPFSVSRVSAHKKLDRIFCGAALTLSNTNSENRTYNHAAVSFAYRNVLFNSIFLRFGITGKLIQNNAGNGYHDLFSFQPDESSPHKSFGTNFNYNITFASSHERFYLTASYLNHSFFLQNRAFDFPKYVMMQMGNLASLFAHSITNHQINFIFFTKKGSDGVTENNYYISLFYALRLNRTTTLLAGGRTGYSSAGYFHFLPSLSMQLDKMMISLTYSFYNSENPSQLFVPSYQTQLNFNLWKQKKYSYTGHSF